MTARTRTQLLAYGWTLVATLLATPAALAGGFGVSLERPDATSHPRLKDAVLLVHPEGCIEAGTEAVSVTAEGIVNGQRRSVSVPATRIAPGVFAIRHTWPSEGRWVLAIRGSARHISGPRVVQGRVLNWSDQQMPVEEIRSGSGTRQYLRARTVDAPDLPQAVETALGSKGEQASAGGGSR